MFGLLFLGGKNSRHLGKSFISSEQKSEPLPKKKLPISEGTAEFYKEEAPKYVRPSQSKKTFPAIKYRAEQVIFREGNQTSSMPLGTHFIARLLNSIDTRATGHWVKAILPHGAKFKEKASLPKGTLLMGQASYSGKGNKIFIQFSQGVLPSGQEFKIQAHALSIEDRGLGIKGTYYSGHGGKLATTLGLSMAGGMATALTKKEALGEFGTIAPKASMENAFYHGLSQVADMEIQRRSRELETIKPYVTVSEGKTFVVGLTSSLRGDFLNNE